MRLGEMQVSMTNAKGGVNEKCKNLSHRQYPVIDAWYSVL